MVANHPELAALQKAIDRAGSQSELARLIGVSATSVWRMVNRAKRASTEFVLSIEKSTGVSRHDLRPDIYPRETVPQPGGADVLQGRDTGAGVESFSA